MGNLGGMPEMKFLPSGDPVVNFSVAVNRRYKDRDGNQKEATDWFRVSYVESANFSFETSCLVPPKETQLFSRAVEEAACGSSVG